MTLPNSFNDPPATDLPATDVLATDVLASLAPSPLGGEASSDKRSEPKVVLQVLPRLVTGGVERGTVEVADGLVKAGWTAVVVSAGGPMVRELARVGATHVTLPVASKNPLVMAANVGRLVRVIEEYKVDIVHARSRAPAWSARAAAHRTKRAFVTTFHGAYRVGGRLKRWYNSIMTRGERVIAISEFIARHMVETYGLEPSRIRVIHRGVDMDLFDPARVSPERLIQLSRAWRLPDGVPVIMLPGRLTRWKGQLVLLEALRFLKGREWHCLLVGGDQGRVKYRRELEAFIRTHGLEDRVHLVDHCNDMSAAYMLSDVVVSASTKPEAFGRVIAEAQAMGRPVIASDHGGARETVVPGETGWRTPPGDAVALAQAIDAVLNLTADQRHALARRCRDHIARHFSKDSMVAKTLAVYDEVLAARAAGEVAAAAGEDGAATDGGEGR